MSVKTRTFTSAGRTTQHTIPGAYSRFTSAKGAGGLASTSNCVFLGTAFGGEPGKIHVVQNADDAVALLQGQGNLMECIRAFFKPGNELRPQEVGIYRINTAVQASAFIEDAATDNVVKILSRDYGILFNQIQYKVETGTVAGTKKFTEKFKGVENVFDNIEKKSFTVQYTGAAASATMTISATQLTTSCAATPADDLTILFSAYPNVEALVAYINNHASYTCTADDANAASAACSELDAVTAQDIKTAPYTADSNVQAMIDTITDQASFVTAELVAAAVRDPLANTTGYPYLTGGSEGSATSTEWTAALTDLEDEDVQLIGVAIEDASINTLVETHLDTTNSETGKRERRALLPSTQSTIDTAITEAEGKNRYAEGMAYGAYNDYNVNNVWTGFTSMHVAAKLLGMTVALSLNEPLTYKWLDVGELTSKPTKTQQKNAILAGLMIPRVDGSLARVVRSVTTSKLDDLKYVEWSCVGEMLFMSYDMRTLLETTFTGKAGTNSSMVAVEPTMRERLQVYEEREKLIVADPDNPKANPAFDDIQVIRQADVTRARYKANIVAPNNFIFLTHYFDLLVQAAT